MIEHKRDYVEQMAAAQNVDHPRQQMLFPSKLRKHLAPQILSLVYS